MRIASDIVLEKAAALRAASGMSWVALARTEGARRAGQAFFKGAKAPRSARK